MAPTIPFVLLGEVVPFLCTLALYLYIGNADTLDLFSECACFLHLESALLCDFACEHWLRCENRRDCLDDWLVLFLCLGRCGRPLCIACIEFSDCFCCVSGRFIVDVSLDYCCVEFSLCHFSFLSPFGECRLSIRCFLLCLYCIRFF